MFSMLTRPFARSALAPSSQPSSLHTAAAAAASSTSLFTSATALARALTSASLPATAAARVGPSPASLLAAAANSAIGRSSGVTSSLISNHRRFFTTTNAPAAATSSTTAAPASAAAPVAAATESLWDRARTGFWSSGMKTALTGWTAFATTHTVLSHEPIRERLIAAAGSEGKYRVAFGALAAAIAGTLMFRFWRTPLAQRGPVMHNYAKDKKSLSFALMATLKALGVFCVTDAYVSPVPNPLGITLLGKGIEPTDSRAIHRKYQVYGLQRVTRHSEFMGYGIYALGSLLSGRRLAELVLWGLLPVFAIAGAMHQETRQRKVKPQRFFDETSFMPFGAVLDGRQSMSKIMVEIPASAYAAAFVITGIVYFY